MATLHDGVVGEEQEEWKLIKRIHEFLESDEYVTPSGVTLRQEPERRAFIFVSEGRELTMTIADLKKLPKNIRSMFGPREEFDMGEFFKALEAHVVNHPAIEGGVPDAL